MDQADLPARPRLNERALARLHFVGGKCRVLVYDGDTGDVAEIGPREWVLLAAADGTRDLDGILLAASREGVKPERSAVVEMLATFQAAGLLSDGIAQRTAPTAQLESPSDPAFFERSGADEDRKIVALADYAFSCDGLGTCCRLYATIVFSPLEAARARSILPLVLDGGDRHDHVFMPERGAGPCAGSAVALVNGACAYLDGSWCALHQKAGAASKPIGCNLFPLQLVDDGDVLRASAAVECACVLSSVGRSGGDPILPAGARTRRDLDPAIVIDVLPDTIAITPNAVAPRRDFLAWSDRVLAAIEAKCSGDARRIEGQDAALIAWSIAGALDAHGLDADRALDAIERPAAIDIDRVAVFADRFTSHVARRLDRQNGWRSDRDITRRGLQAIVAAAALLDDPDVLAAVAAGAGARQEDERFYLRAAWFGHQLVSSWPVSLGLRDRTMAFLLARVMPLAADALWPGDVDTAFRHPLALVEALSRGHGLRRYLDDIEPRE